MKRKTIAEKTTKELITILDRVFSEYIRLKYSDVNGYCKCVTCGAIRRWNDIHNGHFINRGVKATRFDERNCRPQCCTCNTYHSGKHYFFRAALIDIYGLDEITELEHKAMMGGNHCVIQLQEMIVEYRAKVRELKKEKG
jgi:hypothetical protein